MLFQDHPPFSEFLVRSIPFTTNAQDCFRIMNEVSFCGSGGVETAVAEGLAACLTVRTIGLFTNIQGYALATRKL